MENTVKISDKLAKADDTLVINRYDNGFMVEVSGQDVTDNWASAKIVVSTISEVNALVENWNSIQSR